MFCSKCGHKLEIQANFCPNCGSAAGGSGSHFREGDADKPLLVLTPVFIGWVTALSVLPLQLFFTVWGAGFCGGLSMVAVQALHLHLPPWFTFVFFGCLFFFGIPLVVYFMKMKAYARTEYTFYRDRLEYFEGFWTLENKTIKYDKITESSMRRGLFQRKYGLGSIFLATPATGFNQGRAISGVRIADVKDPEQVYETILKLIGK